VVDGAGGFDVAGAGSAGAACSGGFIRLADVYPCVGVRVFGDVVGFADERPPGCCGDRHWFLSLESLVFRVVHVGFGVVYPEGFCYKRFLFLIVTPVKHSIRPFIIIRISDRG